MTLLKQSLGYKMAQEGTLPDSVGSSMMDIT